MERSILILDDEFGIRASLALALKKKYTVYTAENSARGFEIMRQRSIDVCMLDLRLGEEDGVEICRKIKEAAPEVEVVMMTAYGIIQSTVKALHMGAFNYLTKPLDLNELMVVIEKALEHKQLSDRVKYLSAELETASGIPGMIGKSACMQDLVRKINRLKDIDTGVLIYGESGSGKEVVARALHFSGNRKTERFVPLNCAAIPASLLEEELFGHKKGTFTGAMSDKMGKFQYAGKGSIFLDEIGEMPLELQAKLLRVLESKKYTPLGGNEQLTVNARVIAATNRELKEAVEEGKFRQDLYFRLDVVHLTVPPLRERREDIPLLCEYFLNKRARAQGGGATEVSAAAMEHLTMYDYPGNVRELFNILEYAAIFCDKEIIETDDLPLDRMNLHKCPQMEQHISSQMNLAEMERAFILNCLKKHNGNIPQTSVALGVSDKGLRNKLNKYREEGYL